MELQKIGFYTLSDNRAKEVSLNSDLQRCELILTNRCNFRCPYCRGIKKDLQGDLTMSEAKHIIDLWADNNIRNVRFSGGEPTIWNNLEELVRYTKAKPSIKHIALSTNGSADFEKYKELIAAGVNDFSISLDACCSSTAETMSGINLNFEKISNNIKNLSKLTYVTVGVVLEEKNVAELNKIIEYSDSLGVSDIRIIPSAQWDNKIVPTVNENIIKKYPILNYRMNNIRNNIHVRGLKEKDCKKCHLVLDDMAILNKYHFPCIIYMREQGNPIGSIEGKSIEQIRIERMKWSEKHNCYTDNICKKNCLDVCIDYNNKVENYRKKKNKI